MRVIPKSLPVLLTEPVVHKAAVNQGLPFSTEQYGCRQRNYFIKYAESALVKCIFLHFLGLNRF